MNILLRFKFLRFHGFSHMAVLRLYCYRRLLSAFFSFNVPLHYILKNYLFDIFFYHRLFPIHQTDDSGHFSDYSLVNYSHTCVADHCILLLFIYYATRAADNTHIKETYTIKAYTIKRKPTNMHSTMQLLYCLWMR